MQQVSETKERLEAHLRAKFPQREELSVTELERVPGGVSNVSYYFTTTWREAQGPVSESLVLRMLPEAGPVPPYDDIRPQYEAMKRVEGTGIPVPQVYWFETDSNVLGHPFLVMEKIEGEALLALYNTQPELQAQLNKEYIDCLVKIHGLDWQAVGLSVLGVPENDRQHAETEIERWEWVMEQNQFSPQPVLAEAFVWLKRNITRAERTALCHGDYYAHNFFCRGGHIVALLDWELAGIGDPIIDLAWSAVFMNTVGGFWNETDFIKAYEEATGAKVNEESLFFWKLLCYVRFAAASWGAFRNGLESKELEVHNLGIFCRLLPLILDQTAKMLKF